MKKIKSANTDNNVKVQDKKPATVNNNVKIHKEESKLTPKEQATKNKESYIEIIGFEINKKNMSEGAFELDWNKYFILELRSQGFTGITDEEIVDQWFSQVCRNTGTDVTEDELNDYNRSNFTITQDIGNGRTEIK